MFPAEEMVEIYSLNTDYMYALSDEGQHNLKP